MVGICRHHWILFFRGFRDEEKGTIGFKVVSSLHLQAMYFYRTRISTLISVALLPSDRLDDRYFD